MAWQLYSSYTAPLNNVYIGPAQLAAFSFSAGPDQLDFINNFFINQYIAECQRAIQQESPGDDLLDIAIWRDVGPLFRTDYWLEIKATDRTGADLPWTLLILVGLAVVLTWLVIRPILETVIDLVYGPPGPGGTRPTTTLLNYLPWIAAAVVAIMVVPEITKRKSKGDT